MISERQVGNYLGGNFATLKDYMDAVRYRFVPFGTNRTVTVTAANAVAVDNVKIPGTVSIGSSSANINAGVAVALNTGGTITGETSNFTDSEGNIVNYVELRDSTTNDPVLDASTGKRIFGLLQVISGTADSDAIGAPAAENLLISFVIFNTSDALTLVTVTGTFEFRYRKVYATRYLPTKAVQDSYADVDVMQAYSPKIAKLTLTANFVANEVLTLSTGAGATAGTSTVTGVAVTLPASAPLFNTTDTVIVRRNGLVQNKGVEVIWDSTGSLHFVQPMESTEYLEVQV